MIGFFITLAITLFITIIFIWRCWLKDMIEGYIDDLFCCGYGEQIKDCCGFCCILFECCKNERNQDNNLNVETKEMELVKCEEKTVITPNGTLIKRKIIEI